MTDRRSFLKKSGAMGALLAAAPLGMRAAAPAGTTPAETDPAVFGPAVFGPADKAERILPPRLKEGDTIGLVTPGSSISEEQLARAVGRLEGLGYRAVYNDTVLSEYGYFAGPDQERADELMDMFTREDVNAIWCARGGYGSIRILDLLDYEAIRQNPKVFLGYSDITALHTAIYQESGLVTFHGPVGTSDFNRFSMRSMRKVLLDPQDNYKYPYRREKDTKNNPEFDRYTINGGSAEGELIGGNVSVLDSMIGTRYEPDFEGRIAYLEDVGEKTYRMDKMLFHLLSGTNLKKAAGIVLGACVDCNVNDEPRLDLKTALDDLMKPLDIPVAYGLSFGHIARQFTIPNGIRASFDADKMQLGLLEAAVL